MSAYCNGRPSWFQMSVSPGEEYQIYLGSGGCFLNPPTAKNPVPHPLGTFETKMATCYSQPDDLMGKTGHCIQ